MAKGKRWTNGRVRRTWRRIRADCSEEMGAYLDSLELTAIQRKKLVRAVRLAQTRARAEGRVIDTDGAMETIAESWLREHPVPE